MIVVVVLFHHLTWIILVTDSSYQSNMVESNININYAIDEELPVSYHIGNIINDSKFNKSFLNKLMNISRFTLYAEEDAKHYFSLNTSTGTLYQSHRLDREVACEMKTQQNPCTFKLIAFLMPNFWFRITIFVRDINDNSPNFQKSELTISIRESEPLFFTIPLEPATDRDLGQFTVQTYVLAGLENTFSLSYKVPNVLNLTLITKLDFEDRTRQKYSGKVVACDGGSPTKCGQQHLTIIILDVNDNKPKFKKAKDSVLLPEFTGINSIIYHAQADDPDSNIFGKIEYSFSLQTKQIDMGFFRINNTNGNIVLVRSLDSVTSAFLSLKLLARDELGMGPHTDEMDLQIYIESKNRNHPTIFVRKSIESDIKELSVIENSPIGTFIGIVIVKDPDKFENGQTECIIKTEPKQTLTIHISNRFKQKTLYAIKTSSVIDCEKTPFIAALLTCSDFGSEPKSSSLTFNVTVIDINEHPPQFFNTKQSASVTENSPPGIHITTIKSHDKDCFSKISYFTSNKLFKIDQITGELYTYQPIDRESIGSSVYLHILAVDSSGDKIFSSETTIIVHILDLNDNFPTLTNYSKIFVTENRDFIDNKIAQLNAIDPDLNENGTFDFEINAVYENRDSKRFINNETFSIDQSTGEIYVAPKFRFDYEKSQRYELQVIIRDRGVPRLSSEYTVSVDVVDINDNNPQWDISNRNRMQINITEDYDLNNHVVKVLATDCDSPNNSNITYHLVQDGDKNSSLYENFFLSLDGMLFVKNQLMRGKYVLKIQACDNGDPPLYSEVLVLQVNVNIDHLISNKYSLNLAMIGITLFLVSGLTLTIIFGVGYLWKTKCRFRTQLSKNLKQKIKESEFQNSENQNYELKPASANIYESLMNDMILENNFKLYQQNLPNKNLLITSPVLCHELECSSTDSGRGASDENQYHSDKASSLLKQLSPQICCYTMLPNNAFSQCGCISSPLMTLNLDSLTNQADESLNTFLPSLNPTNINCSTCQLMNSCQSTSTFTYHSQ